MARNKTVSSIVFANRKGGCGKTTTAVNVAHATIANTDITGIVSGKPDLQADVNLRESIPEHSFTTRIN
jgi:MinD-like ATPase involved in chromosome partitioning or flagellar assembly